VRVKRQGREAEQPAVSKDEFKVRVNVPPPYTLMECGTTHLRLQQILQYGLYQ